MKRKLPPHIVLPDGRWRFVKRGSKAKTSRTINKRRNVSMAKKKGVKHYARAGFGSAGGFKGILVPIAAGAADSIINPMLPINGVGSTAIGMLMGNQTIKDIGLWQVGASLPGMFMPGGIGGKGTGVYL